VAKGRVVGELLRRGAPGVERLVASAEAIGLRADDHNGGVVIRVPTGWGLINPPKK
jgi:hypothetical protein